MKVGRCVRYTPEELEEYIHQHTVAHYVTVLTYQPDVDGRPAMYRGPLYGELDEHTPADAFGELRRGLEVLRVEYDLPLEAVRLWHSGERGAHLTLPAVVLGADAGHPRLPAIYRAMLERLFPPTIAPSLDRGVYNLGKGRMWRLSNRRRPDNGRVKVSPLVRTPRNLRQRGAGSVSSRLRRAALARPGAGADSMGGCVPLDRRAYDRHAG